jgi:hypothetical protein
MADVMRVRKAIEVEHYPVASATVIEIGDLLYYDGTANQVFPLADFTWNTNLATTQADLKGSFAGVAMSRSRAGDTDLVRVAISGIAEFPCAAAAFNPDEFISVDDNAGGDALESQKVIAAAVGLSFGKADKVTASTTVVRFRFWSDIAGQPLLPHDAAA